MPSIGKITGLCADYSQATMNGRPYDKIYERILSGEDFRFNEMMSRGGIPCELGHPTDFDPDGNPRTETDPTKVAVILTNVKRAGPKKLVADGEIRDTPNGKIFKELSEVYTFGLSSRGSYEVQPGQEYSEGPDGWNQDSYTFKGFDLVLLPANPGSRLSVTEGISKPNNKITKVARESIDVNKLAEATQVSEDQIEKALDQLFTVDDEAKSSEEVPVNNMEKEEENLETPIEGELTQTPDPEAQDEPQAEENQPTLVADGAEVEKIRADLQTALDEIKQLTENREKDGLEISNRDAEILKLSSEVENLQSELDERIKESEEFVEKFETLKEMSSKLLESYQAAKAQFESRATESQEEEVAKVKELEKQKAAAEESLLNEKRTNLSLRKELASAKESLISAYSTSFGVAPEALKASLGKTYSVNKIKPAAESLANQISRYPAYQIPVAKKRSVATESQRVSASDEVERELYDLIEQTKN